MSQSNSQHSSQPSYFPEESKEYIVEIPAQAKYLHKDKNPSGFDPIESIQLEGLAYRHVSSGKTPVWVTLTLWFLLGMPLFAIVIPLLGEGFLVALPYLLIGIAISTITWRGVKAKLNSK